ncbi:diguanylate cyclase [Aliiglaciecola sp. LCG003]|uniref:GGDEF domain-containing response regulator n=1 Tax=Aliiglaciecola sp. LCG003 TaxID=3053655 RepID=UPI0025739022|nr:diguanylate cyclase [Aliiglaciecola sp. LCG003]WJG07639.1 diguanylate cyclase [Aliiglaciecola sp. LCG003]
MSITSLDVTLSKKSKPKPHVLIVDDVDINLVIAENALNETYTVATANSGYAALEYCRRNIPDLILLDIEMPGMSGLQVCEELKLNSDTRDIRIIFLTSHGGASFEDKCWEAGCIDFITKPYAISTLRHRVNSHIQSKLMADELRSLSFLDGLTGLYNRRYFDGFFATQLKLAARSGFPLGLLILDIDHFKKFNDSYGHLAGDECLKLVGRTLQQLVARPTDCVARFGGEEFVVVLPNISRDGLVYVASKILKKIRSLEIENVSDTPVKVTLSIGAVLCEHGSASAESLISEADKLLYSAKDQGRDQFMI